jgi:hypothetical protein
MNIHLTDIEMRVLAGDIEHAPSCVWSYELQLFYKDDDGREWADETCTVPRVEKPCTCGYFAALQSGQDKLRAYIGAA